MFTGNIFNRPSTPNTQASTNKTASSAPSEKALPSASILVHEDDPITQKLIVKRFERHAKNQGLNLKILTEDTYEGSIAALKKPVDEGQAKVDGLFTDNQTKNPDGSTRDNAGLALLAWVDARVNAKYAPFIRVMNSSDPVEKKATQSWLAQKFHNKKEQKTLDPLILNTVRNLKSLKREGVPTVTDDTSVHSSRRPSVLSRTSTGLPEQISRSNSDFFNMAPRPPLVRTSTRRSFTSSPTEERPIQE